MLTDSNNLITQLLSQGKTEEEIVKLNPLAKYHDNWNWGFITTEKMTRQMVKGLSSTSMMSKVKTHKHSGNSHTHSAKSHSH